MFNIVAWMVAVILFVLSAIHIYWLFGGKRGIKMAIPSTGTDKLFIPSQYATAAVAILLAAAGVLTLIIGKVINYTFIPTWFTNIGSWMLILVFFIRAIGDFKWLGFFKKKANTLFAKWDTILFSPLCLFLALAVFILVLSN